MTDDLLILEALANREAEIARLHDEIERLRGLLREAVLMYEGDMSIDVDEWMQRVREALGE